MRNFEARNNLRSMRVTCCCFITRMKAKKSSGRHSGKDRVSRSHCAGEDWSVVDVARSVRYVLRGDCFLMIRRTSSWLTSCLLLSRSRCRWCRSQTNFPSMELADRDKLGYRVENGGGKDSQHGRGRRPSMND